MKPDAMAALDGRLVVGIDEDGARYFKRLRCHQKIVVLESLNPDGQTAAQVLSLDGSHSLPKIMEALEFYLSCQARNHRPEAPKVPGAVRYFFSSSACV